MSLCRAGARVLRGSVIKLAAALAAGPRSAPANGTSGTFGRRNWHSRCVDAGSDVRSVVPLVLPLTHRAASSRADGFLMAQL